MLLRPLRRAPLMLGGVGFRAGLDEAWRKQIEARREAARSERRKALEALHDDGFLTPEELQTAKRRLVGD